MRIASKILLIISFILPVTIGACKKQPRCGCDEDVINSFAGAPVNIYYDEVNKSARFYLGGDPYSTYYFCNPTDVMDKLSAFDQGAEVLVDCDVFWECNYMYQVSNSSYYTGLYKRYMVTVFDLREDLYGKK